MLTNKNIKTYDNAYLYLRIYCHASPRNNIRPLETCGPRQVNTLLDYKPESLSQIIVLLIVVCGLQPWMKTRAL